MCLLRKIHATDESLVNRISRSWAKKKFYREDEFRLPLAMKFDEFYPQIRMSSVKSWSIQKLGISRTVVSLGLVSLFTDISSEMIYPLLPVFLAQVLGAGALSIGLIEGVAETTSALLKFASGLWADRLPRRKPLIVGGYGLAGIARPLIGWAGAWPHVLLLRFIDRVGKGLRSAPRDALIVDTTPSHLRGTAFGFHQAMDHAGAVLGPLLASVLLALGLSLRETFLLSAIPAMIAMLIVVFWVREQSRSVNTEQKSQTFLQWSGWRDLDGRLKFLLLTILLFTLGNSTDAFLLIRLAEAGVPSKAIALLWSAHHIVKMLANWMGGRITDQIGAKKMIVLGWLFYALVYLGFAWSYSLEASIFFFMIYGLYYGCTEPAERALVSHFAPPHLRATVFGYYAFTVGVGALPASVLFGWIWQKWGAPQAFLTGATLSLLSAFLLFFLRPPEISAASST